MAFDLVVGVAGQHSAGNDTVRELLERKLPAAGAVTSDCIREEMRERGIELTRDNIFVHANEGRAKFGEGVWARRAWEKVAPKTGEFRYAVIGGIRSPAEVEELKRSNEGRFVLIAVTASLELRYRRVVARKREGEERLTLEAFRTKEERELAGGKGKQNITATLALADFRIENDGTLGQLEGKVDELVAGMRAGV